MLGEVECSDERQDVGAQGLGAQGLGGFMVEHLGGAVLVANAVERVARRASGTPDMVSHLVEAFLVKVTP